jgi:hypothetical protein
MIDSDLVKVKTDTYKKPFIEKTRSVVYETANMAGAMESPVYAILEMTEN